MILAVAWMNFNIINSRLDQIYNIIQIKLSTSETELLLF